MVRRVGGWLIENKFFVQVKFSTELWSFSRGDNSGEIEQHLFFIGWYENTNHSVGKMLTINILWLSLQVGLAI